VVVDTIAQLSIAGCSSPDPTSSPSEKRAIPASWTSDASAIASCPALRALDGLTAPVHIDESSKRFARWMEAAPATRQAANRCGALSRAMRRRLKANGYDPSWRSN
jgi:hypothetical protein